MLALTVALALGLQATVCAGLPSPGTHGVDKRWPGAAATMTNFSPFEFDARMVALTPDPHDGVWFGVGSTLEHIDRFGRMRNLRVASEYLWQVSGITYDRSGALWFSLGQSGRIGTIAPDGQVRTQILVPRRDFPDIRAIAFDGDGTLWFDDVGRRSIGKRFPDGVVREFPVPQEAMSTAMTACRSRIWVAAVDDRHTILYTTIGSAAALWPMRRFSGGSVSIACDDRGSLHFMHVGYRVTSTEGYFDGHSSAHERPSPTDEDRLFAGAGGSIWRIGFGPSGGAYPATSNIVLTQSSRGARHASRLENAPATFAGSMTSTADGTAWIALEYPNSILRVRFDR